MAFFMPIDDDHFGRPHLEMLFNGRSSHPFENWDKSYRVTLDSAVKRNRDFYNVTGTVDLPM
jgi:hypothetical protein